jgi:hypothetical protein
MITGRSSRTKRIDVCGSGVRDDKLVEAELKIREKIVSQTKDMLESIVANMTNQNAPRALRLVEQIAETQRGILSSVTLCGEGPKEEKEGRWHPALSDSETYGAKAVEQLASTLGDAIGPSKETRIRDLTRAIRDAKAAEEDSVVNSLREELANLLVSGPTDESYVAAPQNDEE